MRRLAYARISRSDLRQATLAETQPGSGPAARARMKALTAAIDGLQRHPCRWRPDGAGKRTLIAGCYRVIGSVSPDTGSNETAGDVTILRILGPGQMN